MPVRVKLLCKNLIIIFLSIAYRGDLQTLLDAYKRGTPIDVQDRFMKTPLMVGKLLNM
jgi:hypothetical protein